MAIDEPVPARRHKKDRSSIGSKTTSDRLSIGSRPLSFHQKKGRFTGGAGRTNPDRLDRLRKDALDDFKRSTVKREQSVHQMAAMFASSGSDKIETGWSEGVACGVGKASPGGAGMHKRSSSRAGALGGLLSTNVGVSRSSSGQLETMPQAQDLAAGQETNDASSFYPTAAQTPAEPTPVKYTSFSSPTPTSLRALDLKKIHLDEALNVTSHRRGNVKDIASGFRGESRPENVEVFHKRHAQQEAAYRHTVHEGKETLKKTSQGTDAMYNFVLKLNLATTEGKERFMRRWAVGRIANGESTTPREGWKFLQSLGIDVERKAPPSSATTNPVSPENAAETAPARGRGRTRENPGRFRSPRAGGMASSEAVAEQETAAWESALSRAVGALVRVDADACAPKLRDFRRRRSGSEPRRDDLNIPQAPETCRAPRTTSFFGAETPRGPRRVPQAPETCRAPRTTSFFGMEIPAAPYASKVEYGVTLDEDKCFSLSPPNLVSGPLASMKLWNQDGGRRPQSQGFNLRGESLDCDDRLSESSRPSEEMSFPDTPNRGRGGVRFSLTRLPTSPGRFSLSPGRTSDGRSPLTPAEEADLSAATAMSAKVSWDCSDVPPLGLRLPSRLLEYVEDSDDDHAVDESGILDVSDFREGGRFDEHDGGVPDTGDIGSEEEFGASANGGRFSGGGCEGAELSIDLSGHFKVASMIGDLDDASGVILEDGEEAGGGEDVPDCERRASVSGDCGAELRFMEGFAGIGRRSPSEGEDEEEEDAATVDYDGQDEGEISAIVSDAGWDDGAAAAACRLTESDAEDNVARSTPAENWDPSESELGEDDQEAAAPVADNAVPVAHPEIGLVKGGVSAAGDEEREEELARVSAVRETLENLTAGVAILMRDEKYLLCSEVLPELQSEVAGDGSKVEGAADTDAVADPEEEPAKVLRKGSFKDLKIAVGADLVEEEPPVPRLEWGVHNMEMDSPLTPSIYDENLPERCDVAGDLDQCSGRELFPNTTPLPDVAAAPRQASPFSGSDPFDLLPAVAEGDEENYDGERGSDPPSVDADALLLSEAFSSIWEATVQVVPSPLVSPRADSSGDIVPAMELATADTSERSGVSPDAAMPASPTRSLASPTGCSYAETGIEIKLEQAEDAAQNGGEVESDDSHHREAVPETELPEDLSIVGNDLVFKIRSMTDKTEDTASPSSRRVSAESNPSAVHEGGLRRAGSVEAPEQSFGDHPEATTAANSEKEEALALAPPSELNAVPIAAFAAPLPSTPSTARPKTGEPMETPVSSPAESMGAPTNRIGGSDWQSISATSNIVGAGIWAASDACDRSMAAVAGSHSVTSDSCGSTSVPRESEEEMKEEEGGEGHLPLSLEACQVANPYEDFDAIHDREHFRAAKIRVGCKTPRDLLNFCRPRPNTVYESAKGNGPGFFDDGDGDAMEEAIEEIEEVDSEGESEAAGAYAMEGNQSQCQGCSVS